MDKVEQIADHVNTILRYIPYVQANFVLGLDSDQGAEPFELTKRFIDLAPGALPAYSLLSAYGRSAPVNLDYQRAGRVLPFPFHVINNVQSMNVRPRNYSWAAFYDHLIDLVGYSFSWRAMARRFAATNATIPRWLNVVRGLSSEGTPKIRYHGAVRRLIDTDPAMLNFMEGESDRIPDFYVSLIRRELGPVFEHLPPGSLNHDPNAFLKSEREAAAPLSLTPRAGRTRTVAATP